MHFTNGRTSRQSIEVRNPLRCLLIQAMWLLSVVGNTMLYAEDLPVAQVDYDKHIRPIFTQHCAACHGGVKQAGELSFVYPEQVLNVVEPGSAESSYLFDRIIDEDDESRMPPADHGPPLRSRDVELIRQWIDQGATWGAHWAYQLPVQSEALPDVSDSAWCRQPIDSFILNRLDQVELKPAADERPARWLRRVALDLVGLPPSLEDRDRFLNELKKHGEIAYEEAVDRLLASPQFGERWTSVWLDQVRYADSRGLSEDSERDIWKYRDWVIDAFNQDMPYDEFTLKQIAGDLLPERSLSDHLATAVHRLTHSNEEGGTDDEEFRTAAVLDRVSTTWQAWQGTTIGCVQCHDHPYDPFKHEEFYQFVALFNNTADCDLTDDWPVLDVPLDASEYEQASQLDRQIDDLTEQLWQERWQIAHNEAKWQPLRINRLKSSNRIRLKIEAQPTHDEYRTEGNISTNPTVEAELAIPAEMQSITGIRLTGLPLDIDAAKSTAEVGFVMSDIKVAIKNPSTGKNVPLKIAKLIGDEPFPHDSVERSLHKDSNGFGAYTRVHHPRHVVLLPEMPIQVEAGSTLEVKVRYGVFDLAAFILVARSGYYSLSSDPALTSLVDDESAAELESQLQTLKAERKKIKSIATPVLRERPTHLSRDSHVFIRGLFLTKGEKVEPGIPDSLNFENSEIPNRLALANWLISDQNPLTARVAVNRLWAQLFGTGLVETEEDFGAAGEPPSHPELLDDLAVRFRDQHHWSVKSLLREIVLSRTYRQSAQLRPELQEIDPQNRLLARGPRHNLPAETLRDQMLAISGLLSLEAHGKPAFPPLPSGVWRARRGSWKTPPLGDPDRNRRSVYTYVKRSVPFPMFASFDAPSRDQCSPRRQRSNTPLQSLMLLNDKTFVECTQAFAKTIAEQTGDVREQIASGFLNSTLREASATELDQLCELHDEVHELHGQERAMEAVAGVLLNLDEIIMK